MSQKIPILVLACLLGVLPIAVTEECPSQEDVSPCTCRAYAASAIRIECRKIDNQQLALVAGRIRGKTVESFAIHNFKSGFIPYEVFEGVKLEQLEIYVSTLVSLTDKGKAFVGLEDHLKVLVISFCTFKNEWDWTILRTLKDLRVLSISNSLQLETLGTAVMKASVSSSLEHLTYYGNNLAFVDDRAFDSFKYMSVLHLEHNKIKNMKRTMFPNPALNLGKLYLSNNLIEQFPEDMFTNMPDLEYLWIKNNKIQVLDEKTFSTVWERLRYFYAEGNALHCDCRLSWLLEKRTPSDWRAECASPSQLRGKMLRDLKSKDFACYA